MHIHAHCHMAPPRLPPDEAEDKLALLREHSLLGQLPPAVLEHLGSYMRRRSLPRGTAIFAKGDPGTGLMGVLAGTVKISMPSADGRDIVLNVIHEGEIFGEIALLDGRPHTADASAMTECKLMVIEGRDFIPFLSSHPELMMKIIKPRRTTTSREAAEAAFKAVTTKPAETPNAGGPLRWPGPGGSDAVTHRRASLQRQQRTTRSMRAKQQF